MDLKEKIRSIENFPEEGVIFRDITTLLKEGDALREAIDQIQTNLDGVDFDLILGPESRGFIFGMPLAYNLKKALCLCGKKANCLRKSSARNMHWNMAQLSLKCIKTPSSQGRRLLLWMTCWQQAALQKPSSKW